MKFIVISLLISLSSCKKESNPITPEQSAEQLYINGQIYTVNPMLEWAEAMLVDKGKIMATGSNEAVRA